MLFPMLNVLYCYISTFRSVCVCVCVCVCVRARALAVLNMADFYSPLIVCFPGLFLRYCVNDFKIVPVTTVFTGIIFVSILHIRCLLLLSLFLCYRRQSVPFHPISAPVTDILLKDDSCTVVSMLFTEFGPNTAKKICCPFCEY